MTDSNSTPYVRPDVAQFLTFLNAQEAPPVSEADAATVRATMTGLRVMADADPSPLAVVRDVQCPGPVGNIPCRFYDSRSERAAGPILVFFHGGGWVVGDIDTHEPFCTRAAELLDMPVLSVDYRLAPENPWPAGPEDCEAVARWAATSPTELGFTVTALTLGGDSAGGNLTIVTAMALRDKPAAVPVIAQLPIYPATDFNAAGGSLDQFAEKHLLTRETMDWFSGHYAADPAHPSASPLLYDQTGMPPAVVVTASLDPIGDQGRAYVGALAKAGVEVRYHQAQGTIHGFICLRKGIPSAAQDVDKLLLAFKSLVADVTAAA